MSNDSIGQLCQILDHESRDAHKIGPVSSGPTRTEIDIAKTMIRIGGMLFAKNRAYGDSALNPACIFSRLCAKDAIAIRLDDKLKRIQNNPAAFGEDVVLDIIGYLVLYMIAIDREPQP